MTEQEIINIRKKLELAKSEYDKAVGSLDSLKKQILEIEDVKKAMEKDNLPIGKAISVVFDAYSKQIEEEELALQLEYNQFMDTYNDLL